MLFSRAVEHFKWAKLSESILSMQAFVCVCLCVHVSKTLWVLTMLFKSNYNLNGFGLMQN